MDLQKLLTDVCKRARLDKIPKLTVCRGFTAQARLGKIRIGRRLCSLLSEQEMGGVIAHEVHHLMKLKKYTALFISVGILIIVAAACIELNAYLAFVRQYPVALFYITPSLFQVILLVSVTLLSLVFSRRASRIRELRADRFAASIAGRRTFADTLKKVHSIPTKPRLRSRLWEWLFPHPPLNKRLEAIHDVKRVPHPARQPASE